MLKRKREAVITTLSRNGSKRGSEGNNQGRAVVRGIVLIPSSTTGHEGAETLARPLSFAVSFRQAEGRRQRWSSMKTRGREMVSQKTYVVIGKKNEKSARCGEKVETEKLVPNRVVHGNALCRYAGRRGGGLLGRKNCHRQCHWKVSKRVFARL